MTRNTLEWLIQNEYIYLNWQGESILTCFRLQRTIHLSELL